MKRICVLLNGPVHHDGRVIKTINTLSQKAMVDLYYIDGEESDKMLINSSVTLNTIPYKLSIKQKFLRHTFFYKEFDFFANHALRSKIEYDIIYCNDLPTLNAGVKIATSLNAKLIYDAHEIYTETINQFFPSNSQGIKNLLFQMLIKFMRSSGKRKESLLVKRVDHLITVNESLANYFTSEYKVQQIKIMMNCPILKQIQMKQPVDFRKKFKWKEHDVILYYHGVLNEGRGLNLLINVMSKLNPKYKLVIIGYGSLKTQLMKQSNILKLMDRIKFLGIIPNDQLLKYASGADIGFNLLSSFNKSKALASPNKVFEYIHAGIPSICSNTIENRKILEKFRVGALVKNKEKDVIAGIEVINAYVKNPVFNSEISKAKLHYNWQNQSRVLQEIIG